MRRAASEFRHRRGRSPRALPRATTHRSSAVSDADELTVRLRRLVPQKVRKTAAGVGCESGPIRPRYRTWRFALRQLASPGRQSRRRRLIALLVDRGRPGHCVAQKAETALPFSAKAELMRSSVFTPVRASPRFRLRPVAHPTPARAWRDGADEPHRTQLTTDGWPRQILPLLQSAPARPHRRPHCWSKPPRDPASRTEDRRHRSRPQAHHSVRVS